MTPQGIPHGVTSPVEVGGQWELQPGTMVLPLHWAVNMDSKTWAQPDTFRPARFLDTEGKLSQENKIFPFQVRNDKLLLSHLYQVYRFYTLLLRSVREDVWERNSESP